jgi:hypothetical protein
MEFSEHDQIITAYAQKAHGPGWSNQPVWVVVRSRLDSSYRLECLQPDEFSMNIWALYDVSEAAHKAMVEAIKVHLAKRDKSEDKNELPT